MKKNNQWWSDKRKERKNKIPDQIKDKVKDFYLSTGISKVNPTKKA